MPTGDPTPPPRFHPLATAIYAALWVLLTLHGWSDVILGDHAAWLRYPLWSIERVVNRDLDLGESIEKTQGVRRSWWPSLHGTREEVLETSIVLHDDLVASLEVEEDSESVALARVRLALLLAENDQLDAALEVADSLGPERATGKVLRHLYGEPHATHAGIAPLNPPQDMDERVSAWLLEEWMADRVAIRAARLRGDADTAEAIQAAGVARGDQLRSRSEWLLGAHILFAGLGCVAVLSWALRGRWNAAPAHVAPWSLGDGLSVLIRGDVWNRAYFVALGLVADRYATEDGSGILYSWPGDLAFLAGTLFASLPLVWLTWRHLVVPYRDTQPDPFGLKTLGSDTPRLVAIAAIAIAVDLVGTSAIGWGTWWLGFEGDWTEGFDETLVWSSTRALVLSTLDYTIWTPAFEELGFRGLLFFSLRRRLGVQSAALVSATIFSAVHFYSAPGFLTTLWSGWVWAITFERARSLLPGIVSHGVYNGLYVAGLVLAYR